MRNSCHCLLILAIYGLAASSSASGNDTVSADPWPPEGQENAWVGNTIGIDHTVPTPWTKIGVKGSSVSVWGRETAFEGGALPQQIVTQRTPLLIDRVQCLLQTQGMAVPKPMPRGEGKFVEQYPDKAVWTGRTEAEGVAVETRVAVEFDGFTWLTLRIKPNPTVKLKRLILEFPIRADAAKYYSKKMEGYSPLLIKDMWGRVQTRSLKLQDFHLVNEEVGLSFFAEGRVGWMLDRTDRQVEWVVEDGQVKVRYNLIDLFVPRAVGETRAISLGWSAMPVKPMSKDWRRYFVVGCGDKPEKYRRWGQTGMTPVFVKLTRHNPETDENIRQWAQAVESKDGLAYCPWGGNPKPYSLVGFNTYIARIREENPGCKFAIYTVGTEHTALDPVVFENQNEWSLTSTRYSLQDIEKGRSMKAECPCRLFVCGRSSFPDYRVWSMDYLFKKLDIDGYYYDNQIFRPCRNPAHAAHLFTDEKGDVLEVFPLLQTRETYKRIYKALRKTRPDTMIVGHEAISAYPFVDIAIGLEALLKLAGEESLYTSFVAPDDCRGSFFRGHQRGIPFLWLPEYRGNYGWGKDSIRATRDMLSLLWLCDTQYWVAWSNQAVLLQDLKIRGQFKIWQAEWLPFWRQKLASSDRDDVKIAIYRKHGASLLVISNPSPNAYPKVAVSVDVGAALPDPGTDLRNMDVRDAETGHPIQSRRWVSEDKTFYDFSVAIPNQDFRIVVIGTPETVKENVIAPLAESGLKAIDARREKWLKGDARQTPGTVGPAEVIVRYRDGKIDIDGRLDEEAWKEAEKYTGFRRYQDKDNAAQWQTTVRLLYDQNALFVAAELYSPDTALDLPKMKQTTEKDVLQSDCLEWYLGARGREDYYWFAVNARNFKADAHFGAKEDDPFVWDGRWTEAVGRLKDRWVIEAAIPLSEVDLPSPSEGIPWTMNMARSLEMGKDKKVRSVLNHLHGGFHSLDVQMTFEKTK